MEEALLIYSVQGIVSTNSFTFNHNMPKHKIGQS